MEISAKKRFGFKILFVIGVIVGFIALITGFGIIISLSAIPRTLGDMVIIDPIGILFMILVFVISPILLIIISIIGLLLIK